MQGIQLDLPKSYFGFADVVELARDIVAVRLDLLTEEDKSVLEATQLPLKAADNLPTMLVEFEARYDEIREVTEVGPLSKRESLDPSTVLEEDSWYKVMLGESGIPARLYSAPDTAEFEKVKVDSILKLDEEEASQLVRLHQIGQAGEATSGQLGQLLSGSPGGRIIASYNVGQGCCGALCDLNAHPLIYFDLGGGTTSHSSTYPPNFRVCHQHHRPVILSHWDMDHWVTGQKDLACLDHPWLVPNQSVGPTHLKFASQLHARGNLHVWPTGVSNYTAGSLTTLLCTGRSRNDSGLAAIVQMTDDEGSPSSVLIPGDARYSCVPLGSVTSFCGLIASHHGSKTSGSPPRADTHHRLVFSHGSPNKYGHPHPASLADHRQSGWTKQLNTPSGNVLLAPLSISAPKLPPCQQSSATPSCTLSCTLALSQS